MRIRCRRSRASGGASGIMSLNFLRLRSNALSRSELLKVDLLFSMSETRSYDVKTHLNMPRYYVQNNLKIDSQSTRNKKKYEELFQLFRDKLTSYSI